jgi:predicted TIM-barrel fold metal-dependent hydrolase
MSELGYPLFDADNHYYEATDAFTRHMDPRLARRTFQWADIGGRQRLLVCEKVNHFIPNPTFDPVAKAGCLDQFFRGENPEGLDIRTAFGELEPISPAYRNRDARLALMDEQGVETALLFPTLGVGMEHYLKHDTNLTHDALHAFNQWLDEDWGFAYKKRIYAAPMMSLMDIDRACAELDYVLSNGARVVLLRAAPVPGAKRRSIGDPLYDPFWARLNEAQAVVAFHSGESGYGEYASHWGEPEELLAFKGGAFRSVTQTDRSIYDALAALVCHGVFDRHPKVRALSVENGSDWIHGLLAKLKKAERMNVGDFEGSPVEKIKRHVWVAPYYEEDCRALADAIGVERVVMGSDFPHAEGLAEPVRFVDELKEFDAEEIRLVMRDNGRTLLEPWC